MMSFPKIEGYVVTEKLGSGSYSTVYKAYTKVGARTTVAVKCVDKARIKHSGSAVDNLITEIRLLKTLTHPHIVHMKHFTWDDKNIYIIMEYCCGGDLSKYIHRYGRVPEKQVLYFLQQLASALKFLREKGVVHMDLKPHNLLLHKGSDGKYILKVADFGFAQYLSEDSARSIRGSPLYMAPEMIAGEYDARVDLWSVGVIMYECLFGRAPYSSKTFKELMDKIQKKTPIELPRNSSVSPGCADLLTRLLQHDPDRRITYEEFFAHEYLDLEHMPSKENYDKAVNLIKQAIDLDSSRRLDQALTAYCSSLRYLVPVCASESDPVRRSALADKLARYMERAEEIKRQLHGSSTNTENKDLPSRFASGNASISVETSDKNIALATNEDKHTDKSTNGVIEETATEPQNVEAKPQTTKNKDGVSKEKASSFGLKRFFSRSSVPYLDKNDSSICDVTTDSQKPSTTEANDGCRIT